MLLIFIALLLGWVGGDRRRLHKEICLKRMDGDYNRLNKA